MPPKKVLSEVMHHAEEDYDGNLDVIDWRNVKNTEKPL